MRFLTLLHFLVYAALAQTPKAVLGEFPPKNDSWDPFSAHWTRGWFDKSIMSYKLPSSLADDAATLFTGSEIQKMRDRAKNGPIQRVVAEIKTEENKEWYLKRYGKRERNLLGAAFALVAGQVISIVGWTQTIGDALEIVDDATSTTNDVKVVRAQFSALAAIGGEFVYEEGLAMATDGRWLLLRGVFYRVPVGAETRIIPIIQVRNLVFIVPPPSPPSGLRIEANKGASLLLHLSDRNSQKLAEKRRSKDKVFLD
jgi:hypothetical protein